MASRPATAAPPSQHVSSSFASGESGANSTANNNSITHKQHHHPIFSKTHHSSVRQINGGDGDNEREGPPRKRQRLSLRTSAGKGIQTTLDAFTKPPPKISHTQPGAPLVQTLNGVTNQLNITDDELLRASPKPARRKTPQPQQQPAKSEDKRTLRSQDEGLPRLKSELSTYFASYESIIFNAPKEEEFLNVDTALYITDDATAAPTISPARHKNAANARRTSVNGTAGPPPLTPQRSNANQFNGSPVLNLDTFARNVGDNPEDPLTDEHFLKSHRRAERREKQLRNIEKERAMHEKVQLEKILDGLLGHDWLRVLGITGITDGEAKKYEPKRKYFIDEVQALVDKFKLWKEQEKKQRMDKEAAIAAQQADEEGDTSEGSVEPPSSDLNASAARQLQQETIIALKSSARAKGKERAKDPTSHPSTPTILTPKIPLLPPAPPSPEIPITSFYAKRHLRDAALGRSRHGRNITAFGQPVPDMDEYEFELPAEYITEDALRANARERRRRKRESTANNAASKAS